MSINWNSILDHVERETEKAVHRKPWKLKIGGKVFHGQYIRLRGYVITLDDADYLTFNTRDASTAKKWLREYEST